VRLRSCRLLTAFEEGPVFLNILVAVDGSPASRRALAEAVDLARGSNARLTLITVTPAVTQFAAFAGTTPEALTAQVDEWAARILRDARASLPDDVAAHSVQRRGHPGEEIVAELKRGGYDLIVLGSRGRGRAQSNVLGSVNTHVHYHTDTPILSIKGDTETDVLAANGN
jgi:nucleotide-binding universal stress UspA family protein